MTRERVRNYSQELTTWANALQGMAFAWGVSDCCALVRDALEVLYGVDVAPQIPRWTSEDEAKRIWASWSLRDVLLDLGATVVTLSYRDAGDVLCWTPAVPTGPWPGVGVALQTGQVVVTAPDEGVVIVPAYVLPDDAEGYRLPFALEVADG